MNAKHAYNYARKQQLEKARQRFNRECERQILEQLPALRGRFSELGIWDSMNYAFSQNRTTSRTVSEIVARFAPKDNASPTKSEKSDQ
jgi:hypothetical protein